MRAGRGGGRGLGRGRGGAGQRRSSLVVSDDSSASDSDERASESDDEEEEGRESDSEGEDSPETESNKSKESKDDSKDTEPKRTQRKRKRKRSAEGKRESKSGKDEQNTVAPWVMEGEVVIFRLDQQAAQKLGKPFSLGVCRYDMDSREGVEVEIYEPLDKSNLFGKYRPMMEAEGRGKEVPVAHIVFKRAISHAGIALDDEGQMDAETVADVRTVYEM